MAVRRLFSFFMIGHRTMTRLNRNIRVVGERIGNQCDVNLCPNYRNYLEFNDPDNTI